MGFFSRKKPRKRDVQAQQGAVEVETRTDVDVKRVQTQSKEIGSSRELSGRHHEQSSRQSKSDQPAHSQSISPRSKNETMSPKQLSIKQIEKHLPMTTPSPPPSSPRNLPQIKTDYPQSILHKTTHFGMVAPTSPPPIFYTSPVPAYNINTSSRVRFTAPSGGSVASQSEASKVHMMGSVASSSAMSSSMVMSEEDRRLAAMGMGRADPKSDVGRYTEDHDRLNAMGVDPKCARLSAMGMSRYAK